MGLKLNGFGEDEQKLPQGLFSETAPVDRFYPRRPASDFYIDPGFRVSVQRNELEQQKKTVFNSSKPVPLGDYRIESC